MAELLGWFVTDGSLRQPSAKTGRGRKDRRWGPRASLHQSRRGNKAKCVRIQALLDRLAPGETRLHVTRDGTYCTWRLGPRLSAALFALAPQRTLRERVLLDLDRAALLRLREAMLLGDGSGASTTNGTRHTKAKDVFSTGRREQADAFQTLCALTGSATSLKWRDMSKHKPRSAKLTNVPRSKGAWYVTILRRDKVQVTAKQRREYRAACPVWCPVVPNTFFVARRSGHVFITGNTPVQGSANEFQLASVAAIVEWIEDCGIEDDVQVILTVHDALLLEVRDELVDTTAQTVHDIMTSHSDLLGVDMEVGDAWGSLSKYKLAA
jgi:hypothetical protein